MINTETVINTANNHEIVNTEQYERCIFGAIFNKQYFNKALFNEVFKKIEPNDINKKLYRDAFEYMTEINNGEMLMPVVDYVASKNNDFQINIIESYFNEDIIDAYSDNDLSRKMALACAVKIKESSNKRKQNSIAQKLLNGEISEIEAIQLLTSLINLEKNAEVNNERNLAEICSGTLISKFSSEISKATNMPVNSTLLVVLGVVSSVTTGSFTVNYRNNTGFQPLGLNICVEQPPATAKSRVISAAQGGVFSESKKMHDECNKEIEKIQLKIEELDGDKDAKQEIREFKKQIAEIEYRRSRILSFLTDATAEAVDATLSETGGFFAFSSAEQGAINTLLGLTYSDTKGSNKDLILKGYNAEYHNSKRKSRNGYKGFVVGNITAFAQAPMINNLIEASDSTGVIERFIVWSEDNNLGKRDHTKYYSPNANVTASFHQRVEKLTRNYANSEAENLTRLSLSDRAWDLINLKRNEYEPSLRDDNEHSGNILRGLIGKIDIHIMKIAANLHVMDFESPGDVPTLIHDDRVKEAMIIIDSAIEHLKDLIDRASVSVIDDKERLIIDKILASRLKTLTGKQIADSLYRKKLFNGRQSVYDCILKMLGKGLIRSLDDNLAITSCNFEVA